MGEIMLKKFSVKNFKNFDDEISIDFSDHRDYSFKEEYIKNGLINKALLYGKNASGKSNFGLAIMDIISHLVDKNKREDYYDLYTNGNSIISDATFYYEFKFANDILIYNYIKDESRKLVYEEIRFNDRILFKYNYNNNAYSNYIPGYENLDLSKRNQDISVVKYMYANTLNLEQKSPIRLLVEFADHMLWFRSLRSNEYMGAFVGTENLSDFIVKNDKVKDFQSFLSTCGIDLNLSVGKDVLGKPLLCIHYRKSDVPFQNVASTGTQSLWLFYYWMQKEKEISFLYLDEFDAFYHYELSKYILNYVNSRNGFQSILTTQNIFLIDNFIMRPDCYFLIDNGKIKSFANSTNKQIRQSHNLQRMLLGGEFVN